MKLMKTEDAIGQVLCHDITQIIPGVTKDAVFRKGHIITEEDIPPHFGHFSLIGFAQDMKSHSGLSSQP